MVSRDDVEPFRKEKEPAEKVKGMITASRL
jgi:hypothetical protein